MFLFLLQIDVVNFINHIPLTNLVTTQFASVVYFLLQRKVWFICFSGDH